MSLQNAVEHGLNSLSHIFVDAFPKMDITAQRLARKIYQRLAKGEPFPVESLAQDLALPIEQVTQLLNQLGNISYNDKGKIVGFMGISIDCTRHCMVMDGIKSYAWCAWDALFIPELVGSTAQVASTCATTARSIQLAVSPEGARSAGAEPIVISFLIPDAAKINENVASQFCHYVNFFHCHEAGEEWTSKHEGTFLLTLEDAFEIGRQVNAVRYAAVL